MRNKYIYLESVIIEACDEGGFFARYPLLQGCYAEGETYGETIDNIIAVIENHLDIRKDVNVKSMNKIKSLSTFSLNVPVTTY